MDKRFCVRYLTVVQQQPNSFSSLSANIKLLLGLETIYSGFIKAIYRTAAPVDAGEPRDENANKRRGA